MPELFRDAEFWENHTVTLWICRHPDKPGMWSARMENGEMTSFIFDAENDCEPVTFKSMKQAIDWAMTHGAVHFCICTHDPFSDMGPLH